MDIVLHEHAMQVYKLTIERVRRNRERLKDRPLQLPAIVRYEFKLGFYSEIRQEYRLAVK